MLCTFEGKLLDGFGVCPNEEERELCEGLVSALSGAVYDRFMELQVSSFKTGSFHMRGALLLLPWVLVHNWSSLLSSLVSRNKQVHSEEHLALPVYVDKRGPH